MGTVATNTGCLSWAIDDWIPAVVGGGDAVDDVVQYVDALDWNSGGYDGTQMDH